MKIYQRKCDAQGCETVEDAEVGRPPQDPWVSVSVTVWGDPGKSFIACDLDLCPSCCSRLMAGDTGLPASAAQAVAKAIPQIHPRLAAWAKENAKRPGGDPSGATP